MPSLRFLDHGKRQPLLLTPVQSYFLFGVLFAGNVAVLVALLLGASKNREALASIAMSAARSAPLEQVVEPAHPEPSEIQSGSERALRVTVPADWQWRGCHADARVVEIFFAAP